MTLSEKIKLVDDLIREDPDHTLKDYLDILEETALIQKSETMPNHAIGENKRREILTLAATMTVYDSVNRPRKFIRRHNMFKNGK